MPEGGKRYCSPQRHVRSEDTCLTMAELRTIAQDYNESAKDARKRIRLTTSKGELYSMIRNRLREYCEGGDEPCWVDQPFVKAEHKRAIEDSFRPKKPKAWYKNRRTWLNTFDILHVMKQYEKLFRNFAFLGVYPIDFQEYYSNGDCIGGLLCSFSVKDMLARKKTHFAMVLNLDNHRQPGSHWVAVYCNLDPKKNNFGMYYYDSVATPPGQEVIGFSQDVARQVKEHYGPKVASRFDTRFNTTQKQFKNTECGIFSMVFITQMLKYIDYDFICKHMRKDDDMNEIRDVLYRPNYTGAK